MPGREDRQLQAEGITCTKGPKLRTTHCSYKATKGPVGLTTEARRER